MGGNNGSVAPSTVGQLGQFRARMRKLNLLKKKKGKKEKPMLHV